MNLRTYNILKPYIRMYILYSIPYNIIQTLPIPTILHKIIVIYFILKSMFQVYLYIPIRVKKNMMRAWIYPYTLWIVCTYICIHFVFFIKYLLGIIEEMISTDGITNFHHNVWNKTIYKCLKTAFCHKKHLFST